MDDIILHTKKNSSLIQKRRLLGIAFLAPAALFVLICTLIPIVWNIILSFCEWKGRGGMAFIGFSNYKDVFQDIATLRSIGYSITISLVAIVVAMVLGISFALMIYKVARWEGAFFRFVFYSPVMIPMTVIGLLFTFILATDEGLVNNFLRLIGLSGWTQPWLAKRGLILIVIGVIQGWRSSGTIMMLVFTAMVRLPKSLFESCELDGASYSQQIRYIILPIIKPTIRLVLSMMVMWAFKTYDIVMSMTGGGPGNISKTAPIRIIEQAFTHNKYGYASALSIVFAILIIGLILLIRKGLGSEAYEY